MKKKKGFIFAETLIVVAFLTVALLMTYSTYSAIIIKEKTRIKYNDSAYLYRTYYVAKFFKYFRLDRVRDMLEQLEEQYKNTYGKETLALVGFGCPTDIFNDDAVNVGFCENVWRELHISHLYFTHNDLSPLQECTNSNGTGKCAALLQVNETGAAYLKTIGGSGKSGYRIIAEFEETKNGSICNEEDGDVCVYYYATISVGEI